MVNTRTLFNEMINLIENKQYNGENLYKFQDIKLNGVTYLYEIYLKEKLFIIKCKNIFVLFDHENQYHGRYIVHHKKYDNLNNLLFHISTISNQYKLYNGVLLNKQQIIRNNIERKFLNYENTTNCSVCFEYTNETTICNHYLCLTCREIMISKHQHNCPLCRNQDIIKYFSNDTNNIYNLLYDELIFINNNEIIMTTHGTHRNFINHNGHIHMINIPMIMNLIIVREIITNTTSYPIVLTIRILSFFNSFKFRCFFGFFISYFIFISCCYKHVNNNKIEERYHLLEQHYHILQENENNNNNTI